MDKAKRIAPGTWSLACLAAAAWLLCTVANPLLSRPAWLPAQVADLVAPAPVGHRLQGMAPPWPLLLGILCAVAVGAITLVLLQQAGSAADRSRGPHSPGFAASWICVGLAGIATTALAAVGLAIAEWPPARIAWLFQDVQPMLSLAAYWAFTWGWVPAMILKLAGPRQPKHSRGQLAAGRMLIAALLVSSLLVSTVALARQGAITANQAAHPPTEAGPVPTAVVYGSPEVSAATVRAADNWCQAEDVSISWGQAEAATGHRALAIELENQAETTCALDAYPDVAFDDVNGSAMDVLLVHGGSFMTRDPGPAGIELASGEHAVAYLGWNAMAAAGDLGAGSMLVAPYPGTVRHKAPAQLDIVNGGAVTVSAWQYAPDRSTIQEQQRP